MKYEKNQENEPKKKKNSFNELSNSQDPDSLTVKRAFKKWHMSHDQDGRAIKWVFSFETH